MKLYEFTISPNAAIIDPQICFQLVKLKHTSCVPEAKGPRVDTDPHVLSAVRPHQSYADGAVHVAISLSRSVPAGG
jgi:hypothetical protein